MGRANPVSLSRSPVSANDPSAHAAAGDQHPPGFPPQQGYQTNLTARSNNGDVTAHSTKKVKLDGNGLIAVERSSVVTAERPLNQQLQQPVPAMSLPAAAAQQRPAAQHQQGSAGPPPPPPPGDALSGLTLHVEEDRRPISPSQLFQSAARGLPPPPHHQPCADRAPLRVPRLAAAPDCGNSNWTPYKEAPIIRRMSSGQRVSTLLTGQGWFRASSWHTHACLLHLITSLSPAALLASKACDDDKLKFRSEPCFKVLNSTCLLPCFLTAGCSSCAD